MTAAGYARRMPFDTGLVRLAAHPLAELDRIAVAGEAAVMVATAFVAAGGPPLVLESDHFAVLSRSGDAPAAARMRDLPADWLDLAVMRRAWRDRDDVGEAIRVARDRVAPGGEVIAADLDVNRLLDGPSSQYPVRLLYLAAPIATQRLRDSTATPGTLGAEAVRAGLRPVDSLIFDDVLGRHDSAAALWAEMSRRGWRGATWTPLEYQGQVMEVAATGLARALPAGEAVDREPWVAVVGRKR